MSYRLRKTPRVTWPSLQPCARPPTRRRRAFTLVELLVVIAIIALLAALLLPALKTARGKAHSVTCQSGQRQLFVGAVSFANDYGDYLPAADTLGSISGRRGWTGVDASGKPTNDYQVVDNYFGYRRGVHYDEGPLKRSVYFCDSFQRRWAEWTGVKAFSLGYATNCKYNGGPVSGPEHGSLLPLTGDRLASVDKPHYTVYLREFNVPVTMDGFISGPDLWPKRLSDGALSIYSTKFGQIHLGGQNILFFDGHVEYVLYPNAVKCQIWAGYDHTNYSTYPGQSWQWP